MFRCTFYSIVIMLLTFAVGCGGYQSDRFQLSASDAKPTPTPKPIDPTIASLSASELCERLGDIELIHDRVPDESDDLYKAIITKGNDALPCLIEKINDRTKTRDPRTAPKWQHYAVGDTAVFTILDIVSKDDYEVWKELFLSPLPPEYKDEWKTNGVYAYFNYVSEPKNRKELQGWWKNWLSNQGEK